MPPRPSGSRISYPSISRGGTAPRAGAPPAASVLSAVGGGPPSAGATTVEPAAVGGRGGWTSVPPEPWAGSVRLTDRSGAPQTGQRDERSAASHECPEGHTR